MPSLGHLLLAAALYVTVQGEPAVPVWGLQTGISSSGQRPARPNIKNVYADQGPYWDLYIQALGQFQQVSESDQQSYFRIAGIHSLPFDGWNGAMPANGAGSGGMCAHSEVLFPSWHRPYLALFEQILGSHVQTIAKQYSSNDQPAYQAAAKTFRVPYWDWATDNALPQAVVTPNTTVRGPNGATISMINPLYSYRWQTNPPEGTGFGGKLAQWPETKRYPDAFGVNNESQASVQLSRDDLKSPVYETFTKTKSYEQMATISNHGPSFENPHNTVHNDASGTEGTLWDLNWSAFDPLFWLHHCNVDRLYAMWQAINYNDAMFNSTYPSGGHYGTPQGTLISSDSPLNPFFRDNNGTPWTSKQVVQPSTFGYTYPEMSRDHSMSASDLATYVTTQVNRLYAPNSPKSRTSFRRAAREARAATRTTDYTAEISVDRSELDVPCNIQLLLSGTFVGQMTLLNKPRIGQAYTTVQLSDAVAQRLGAMTTDVVIPFLKLNLEARIFKNGVHLPLSVAPSLQVQLQARDVTPRRHDGEFPQYGEIESWPLLA